MATSVAEFLGGKGAAELVVKINPNGSRRYELRDLINVAPNTLSDRLTEGREAGVIETQALDVPETGHMYVLTPKGARLRMQLVEERADDMYGRLDNYRTRLDESIALTQEWTRTHGNELSDKSRNWSILSYYQTDSSDFRKGSAENDPEQDTSFIMPVHISKQNSN